MLKKCQYCGASAADPRFLEFCLGPKCGEEYRRWEAEQRRQRLNECDVYDGFDNEDAVFNGGWRSDAEGGL